MTKVPLLVVVFIFVAAACAGAQSVIEGVTVEPSHPSMFNPSMGQLGSHLGPSSRRLDYLPSRTWDLSTNAQYLQSDTLDFRPQATTTAVESDRSLAI